MSTTTLIDEQQTELNRLMTTVERLQRAGYDEQRIAATIDGALRRPRTSLLSRLRAVGTPASP
jgi:hypothetical protein